METLCCTSVSILVALQILAVLAYTLVLHLLRAAWLISQETVVLRHPSVDPQRQNRQQFRDKIGFYKMVQLSKTGSEFKNILRDVPECKQSVDEEGMNTEKEKSAYSIHVLKK